MVRHDVIQTAIEWTRRITKKVNLLNLTPKYLITPKNHRMSKIRGCALLTSNAIKGKHFNRELSYLVNRSTDNTAVLFSFVERVLDMNHNAIY